MLFRWLRKLFGIREQEYISEHECAAAKDDFGNWFETTTGGIVRQIKCATCSAEWFDCYISSITVKEAEELLARRQGYDGERPGLN